LTEGIRQNNRKYKQHQSHKQKTPAVSTAGSFFIGGNKGGVEMVYDRAGAAKRIRQRRKELGMTSAEVAGKIGRAVHYYGDIERGTCGMSIETLLDLSHYLDLSVDYILFGQAGEEQIDNPDLAYRILKKYDEKTQKEAIEMMKFYLCLRESGKK
jgi:transcriptional regulator with XRE-family HTH domain